MSWSETSPTSFSALKKARRQAVDLSQSPQVEQKPLREDSALPWLVQSCEEGIDLVKWATNHRHEIEGQLQRCGGILFRGFSIQDPAQVEAFVRTVGGELLPYRDRSSPRSFVRGKIYTSTDYPAEQSIFLHSELSYAKTFPLKIAFCCLQPPQSGGETPIADTRRLLACLNESIQSRFRQKGVMYVRNFGDGFGLSWQSVFQTDSKSEVEAFCRENDIEWSWKPGDRLRTKQVRNAIVNHPKTQVPVWFNHAAFFHVSTLEPSLRESLLAEFGEDNLPYNTYYGDGSPIEPEVLDAIRAAYYQETVLFPWQQGDILLLDNMLAAHGRKPFTGSRKVVVGMAESHSQ